MLVGFVLVVIVVVVVLVLLEVMKIFDGSYAIISTGNPPSIHGLYEMLSS